MANAKDLPKGYPIEGARAAREQLIQAEKELEAWCVRQGATLSHDHGHPHARLTLPGQLLLEQAREHLTSTTAFAEVVLDRSVAFEIPVHVSAMDEEGARILEVDVAIQRFLNGPNDAIDGAIYEDALERMWRLKMFENIYGLRSGQDFKE